MNRRLRGLGVGREAEGHFTKRKPIVLRICFHLYQTDFCLPATRPTKAEAFSAKH